MKKLDIKITQRQQDFIDATSYEVLFGGAAGGGKSYAQLIDALLYAIKYPGSKQLVLRRTFKDLERSLIQEHLKIYPKEIYKYKSTNHKGEFSNGSIIEFGYCDHEKDVYRYQGAEYDVVRFDELTHFTLQMYTYLHSRVRGVNNFPKSIRSTTNPGGIGHVWVKDRFIDIGEFGKEHVLPQGTRVFLQSNIYDNHFLMGKDKNYLKRLKNLSAKEQKALLYGDWNITDGQFFYEFKRSIHVCRPFKIPQNWRKYVSIDYGTDMLAALWIAVDENNKAYVYKELYEGRDNEKGEDGRGHIISAAAKRVLEINNNDDVYAYLAPPDLWNARQETGKSAADIFAENKVYLTKTSNRRISGWRALREWLSTEKDEQGGETPRLKIFENCTNIIRTLPNLQHDNKNPEDVANVPHELTHAPDALRGFCVFNTWPGKKSTEIKLLTQQFNLPKEPNRLGIGEAVQII